MDGETVQKWYKDDMDASKDWRKEAREMYDLRAGWIWTKTEEDEMTSRDRVPVSFHRVGPYVDAIVGQQINNRQEIKFLPRTSDDTQTSDVLSEVSRWVDDSCNAEDELTDAFEDMVVCGMGWTETRMDYDEDPQGRLVSAERIDPIDMAWDHTARKRNIADAKHIIRAVRYPQDEAEERWPKIKKIVADYYEEDTESTPLDGTNEHKYENDNRGGFYPDSKEYLILQCQYYEDEKVYKVADPETNSIVELSSSKFNSMKEYLDSYGIRYMPAKRRHYYQCFVCGDELLEKNDAPSQKGFTFRAMCARRDRNKAMWYGVVRGMKDPVKFSSKFFSDFLYILATNRKGGVFYESGAVPDARKFKQEYADPAVALEVNDGALSAGKIKERDAGVFPAGLDRLLQFAVNAVPEVTGMSQELLGLAEKNQPGVLEQQRRQASLTILAPLFDAFRRHCKERGVIVLDMFQYIGDGRVIRVTQENGDQQPMPFQWSPEMGEFDVIVDTASTSPNQKQETFIALQQLLPYAKDMGLPIPPSFVEYLPLPATFVEEWKAVMAPKEPTEEDMLKKRAMEAEVAEVESGAMLNQAKAQAEGMKGQELQGKLQLEQQKAQSEMILEQLRAQNERQAMQHEQMMARMDMMLKQMEIEKEQMSMRHDMVMAEQQREAAVETHQMAMTQAKAKANERKRTQHPR